MRKTHGDIWHVDSEESFFQNCNYAKDSISFANSHCSNKNVQWFFNECYANWKDNNHTVFFKSYITDEYKNYQLSVGVKINPDETYSFNIGSEVTE